MHRFIGLSILFLGVGFLHAGDTYPPVEVVRAKFLKTLDRPRIPLDVQFDAKKKETGAMLESLTFASEKKVDGSIERVPTLILRPENVGGKSPTVIVLHGTGGNKESQLNFMRELVKRGIIAVAIDARYHGARKGDTKGTTAYNAAIVKAWQTKAGEPMEHPFYYDTCWDLWRLLDYLQTRPDVDPQRIGMIGFSMGGIQTWLAASADDRVAVLVPAIAVQSFRWSLENEKWQGRANTIKPAHESAAKDLGESAINAKVCKTLWSKIIPGITEEFDCPSMLRLAAPRPLLILNGTKDANCPIEGAKLAITQAEQAYEKAGARTKLHVNIAEVGHTVTESQRQEALEWFTTWLVHGGKK